MRSNVFSGRNAFAYMCMVNDVFFQMFSIPPLGRCCHLTTKMEFPSNEIFMAFCVEYIQSPSDSVKTTQSASHLISLFFLLPQKRFTLFALHCWLSGSTKSSQVIRRKRKMQRKTFGQSSLSFLLKARTQRARRNQQKAKSIKNEFFHEIAIRLLQSQTSTFSRAPLFDPPPGRLSRWPLYFITIFSLFLLLFVRNSSDSLRRMYRIYLIKNKKMFCSIQRYTSCVSVSNIVSNANVWRKTSWTFAANHQLQMNESLNYFYFFCV